MAGARCDRRVVAAAARAVRPSSAPGRGSLPEAGRATRLAPWASCRRANMVSIASVMLEDGDRGRRPQGGNYGNIVTYLHSREGRVKSPIPCVQPRAGARALLPLAHRIITIFPDGRRNPPPSPACATPFPSGDRAPAVAETPIRRYRQNPGSHHAPNARRSGPHHCPIGFSTRGFSLHGLRTNRPGPSPPRERIPPSPERKKSPRAPDHILTNRNSPSLGQQQETSTFPLPAGLFSSFFASHLDRLISSQCRPPGLRRRRSARRPARSSTPRTRPRSGIPPTMSPRRSRYVMVDGCGTRVNFRCFCGVLFGGRLSGG